jgi:HEAT repeat protein
MRRQLISNLAGTASRAVWVIALLTLWSCGASSTSKDSELSKRVDERVKHLLDPSVSGDERVARILDQGKPGDQGPVLALIRVMRDRSQAAFQLVAEDQSAFGYKVAEMKDGEAGSDPLERVAAILALTRIGTPWVALPDLLLAIDDREPLVANHAAKALVKFGNRSGIPVLLANLSGKILAAETAAEILHELSDGPSP